MTRPESYIDKKYYEWVKRVPCCVCYGFPVIARPWDHLQPEPVSDADHQPCQLKGLSMKSPDGCSLIPLCRGPGTPDHHGQRPAQCRTPETIWKVVPDPSKPHVVVEVNPWYYAAVLRWAYERLGPDEVGI